MNSLASQCGLSALALYLSSEAKVVKSAVLLLLLSLSGCFNGLNIDPLDSNLAKATLNPLQNLEYDFAALVVRKDNQVVKELNEISKGSEEIEVRLTAGRHEFDLRYFKNNQLVAGTNLCSGGPKYQDLKPGINNHLNIYVCDGRGVVHEAECFEDTKPLGERTLIRLSRQEIGATLQDVLSIQADSLHHIPLDGREGRLASGSHQSRKVTETHLKSYLEFAKDIAEQVSVKHNHCSQVSCAQSFIQAYGLRLWRRPISVDETNRLIALFTRSGSNNEAYKIMVAAMIISPNFLYHSEIGEVKGSSAELTGYEIAAKLSYLFWGVPPDNELLQAAAAGTLKDPSVIKEQAKRLMQDARGQYLVQDFLNTWIRSRDIKQYDSSWGEFTPSLREAMYQETISFFNYWFNLEGATLDKLFSADFTIANQSLQNIYGGEVSGEKLIYPVGERRGLLGHGTLLASTSQNGDTKPIHRGITVLEDILCKHLAPMPQGLNIMVPERVAGQTNRERFEVHSSQENCQSCHKSIDGLGFGLEGFDPMGRKRSLDQGKTVNESGSILIDNSHYNFNGGYELSGLLVGSIDIARCMVESAYSHTYLTNYEPAQPQQRCTKTSLDKAFTQHRNVKDLWLDIVSQEAFIKRSL